MIFNFRKSSIFYLFKVTTYICIEKLYEDKYKKYIYIDIKLEII